MLRISDGFQELLVAPNSTNILWQAIPSAFNTDWIPTALIGLKAPFEQNFVLPVVSEVVLVEELESLPILWDDFADLGRGRIDALEVLEPVVE